MSNSLRARISKLAYQGKLSREDADRIRDALEKQMPKKPNRSKDEWYGNIVLTSIPPKHYWDCPSCESMIGWDKQHKHCPECGQKLDWSKQ